MTVILRVEFRRRSGEPVLGLLGCLFFRALRDPPGPVRNALSLRGSSDVGSLELPMGELRTGDGPTQKGAGSG